MDELRDRELWTVAIYAPDGVRIIEVSRFKLAEDAEHYAEQHKGRVFAPTHHASLAAGSARRWLWQS